MLREMRPSELGDWIGFWRFSPWGEERADLRSGVVASIIANVNRDTKKRSTPFRPEEFMLFRHQAEDDASKELSRRLRAAMKSVGKRKE